VRGPTRSIHGPSVNVVTPSETAHAEKIGTTSLSAQSAAAGATTPSEEVRGPFHIDHA